MPNDWNASSVVRGLDDIARAQVHIRQRFQELLNAYHRRSEDFAYWDLIGGEWLLHFSHVVYAAYRDAVRAPLGGQVVPPVEVFADHREFMATVVDDARLATTLRAHVEAFLYRPAACRWTYSGDTKTIGKESGGFRARAKGAAKRAVFSGFSRSSAPFVFCNPYVINGRIEWLAALWKWRRWARQDDFDYPVCTAAPVDAEWRRQRAAEISGTSYGDVVLALMPLYLPVVYLEGYAAYRQQALALGLSRPRVLYTANSLHGHTLFKVLAADWRSEGTRLLDCQHGGGYGIDYAHVLEEYETRVAERFYTWGWSDLSKQVPLPTAARRVPRSTGSTRKRILLMCVNFPNTVYRLHFHPMPGTVETMIAQTVTFVERVANDCELVVRPYPYDYGNGYVQRLRKTGMEFAVDDRGIPSSQAYERSALVVHSYLGTSWLETLALNVPTVCFYDTNTYKFRDSSQSFINRLAAVGICHATGEAAAKHVRAIAGDPCGWWKGADVQAAREAFVGRYASGSPNWTDQWEREFASMIAKG